MFEVAIPLKVETLKFRRSIAQRNGRRSEERLKVKNQLKHYIEICLRKNTLKSFDSFVESFCSKARYKKAEKEILLDIICELVAELMQSKKERREDALPKHPTDV